MAPPGADDAESPTVDQDSANLEGPRLELDELLNQLIDRAQDVMAAQGRLRGLLRANRMIIENVALSVLLDRIVEAACGLGNARYGALGVVAPSDGTLEQFAYLGIDDEAAIGIGHLPEGKGLLGALITDPKPIRLHDIAEDGRSVGFPPNHPPMHSFLGVPIRVRDAVFGNLYLTEHLGGGDFSAEDEELVSSLAATAGVVIENARLFDESRRRQDWLQASTEITRQLLATAGEEPLQVIARRVEQIAEADAVNVVLPTPDGRRLLIEVATGAGADDLTGMSYPLDHTVSRAVIDSGQPILIDDMTHEQHYTVHLSDVVPIGPLMALPMVGAQRIRGALLVGRMHGRIRFTDADLDMATTFANHAAIALELADARADQQRVLLLEDRNRIARDLHDHVIQRLFAAGLSIESVASGVNQPVQAEKLSRVVSDIDQTIRQIRTSIFQLRGSLAPTAATVRTQLLVVATQCGAQLGFQPRVSFVGPIDAMVPEAMVDDLVAVVREGLSNTARHADASRADVALTVTSTAVIVEVTDDGAGMGATERRSGLSNLLQRAELLGGTLEVISPLPSRSEDKKGTCLRWTIPLE